MQDYISRPLKDYTEKRLQDFTDEFQCFLGTSPCEEDPNLEASIQEFIKETIEQTLEEVEMALAKQATKLLMINTAGS